MDLSNKNALVTGAGSGIGRATALALAAAGADIVLNDVNGEGAEAVVDDRGGIAGILGRTGRTDGRFGARGSGPLSSGLGGRRALRPPPPRLRLAPAARSAPGAPAGRAG